MDPEVEPTGEDDKQRGKEPTEEATTETGAEGDSHVDAGELT